MKACEHGNDTFTSKDINMAKTMPVVDSKGSQLMMPHLFRLRCMNVVFVGVFAVSVYHVLLATSFGRTHSMLDFKDIALPLFGCVASLTYFFGFFGVSIIASMLEEDQAQLAAEAGPLKPAAAPKAHNFPYQTPYDVVVVGAGTAGATMANAMARQGRKVLLVERDMKLQDRIVGELLQPGGLRALERMGLDDCAKDGIDSVRVDGYTVILPGTDSQPGEEILLNYPDSDPHTLKEHFGVVKTVTGEQESQAGSNPKGRSFHNGRFVQRLRETAMKDSNITVVEGTVCKLIEEKGNSNKVVGIQYNVSEKGSTEKVTKEAYAPLTIVADGIWSGLRSKIADNKKDIRKASSFVGLLVKHEPMQAPVPHRHYGHVILAQPSPILIYQIASTETRVLVDINGSIPSQSDGSLARYFKEEIAPQLPSQFQSAFVRSVETEGIKSMPNRTLPAKITRKEGVFAIGDALNMRHPLTGGGMTVGIRDVELMTNLLRGIDFSDYKTMRTKLQIFSKQRKSYAATINILADALHSVFSTPGANPTRLALREACYEYLKMGGVYSAGPIGLLSGLTPRPGILVAHFFMVAGYGIKNLLLPLPTPSRVVKTYNLLHVACMIIMPLLKEQSTSVLSFYPCRKLINLIFPWENKLL